MTFWVLLFGGIYMAALFFASKRAKDEQTSDPKSFILGGSDLNICLGVLTYSATLFSTFTLMGMPNFFRIHGVGAWIFLGVTDVAMAFVALILGMKLREKFVAKNCLNVSRYLKEMYGRNWVVWIFLFGIFVFLIPYTAIQIKGVAQFLEITAPFHLPMPVWAVSILLIILVYSTVGGFKAIVYSDAIQGVLLLCTSWIIAGVCLSNIGGFYNLFQLVEKQNEALLSVPGPKGLFSVQFLLSSFLAIIVMPISQPQLTTRLVAMKNPNKLRLMAPSVAFFAILVIFPAVILGMYGAVHYSTLSAQEFWGKILVHDQHPIVAALAIVGLLAAAMSTTDSQLFALGNEANILLKNDKNFLLKTKGIILIFASASLLFAIFSKDQLVPLARLSFAGTALLAPLILTPILSAKKSFGPILPLATLVGLIWFLAASFIDTVPKMVGPLRVDLFLFIALTLIALFPILKKDRTI